MTRRRTDPRDDLGYIEAVLDFAVPGGAPPDALRAIERLRDAVDVARAAAEAVERAMARTQRSALTLREAARRLGIRQSRLADLVAQRRVHAIKFGRGTRVPAAEIERLAEQGLPGAGRQRRQVDGARPPSPGVGDRILALRRGR